MIIDLHAHYVPQGFLEAIEKEGAPSGATLRRDREGPTILVGGRPYGPITRHYYETKPRLAEMDKAGGGSAGPLAEPAHGILGRRRPRGAPRQAVQ